MITIGILHSTIRGDEKLLIAAARQKDVKVKLVDIRNETFDPETFHAEFDIALERSVSNVKGMYAAMFFESQGIPVVNTYDTSRFCEDKFLTSLKLHASNVPSIKFALTFSEKQTKSAVDALGGYPVVIKPALGSWGRMLAKINDDDGLEAIIEHKEILGSPQQKVFYIQEYVEKKGRDIRAFTIGGETICAIYRTSPHWITNTAKGGTATNCPVSKELAKICQNASEAIGGGVLAMDLFEIDEGLKINEINHTMEFKNSEKPTGVSISGAVIDYCLDVAKERTKQ